MTQNYYCGHEKSIDSEKKIFEYSESSAEANIDKLGKSNSWYKSILGAVG